MDKELKEEHKRKEEARMLEKYEQMQQTREKKEWYENNVEKIGQFLRGFKPSIYQADEKA